MIASQHELEFGSYRKESLHSLFLLFCNTYACDGSLQEGDADADSGEAGSLDDAAADDGYNPAEGKVLSESELKEHADKFNADISSRMKDRGDLFDEMVVHEEQIRLGEQGWKERYYQVSSNTPKLAHLR